MTGNFAKSPPARFSSDEDDRLIDFVMQHKILYDLKDPEFKNTLVVKSPSTFFSCKWPPFL